MNPYMVTKTVSDAYDDEIAANRDFGRRVAERQLAGDRASALELCRQWLTELQALPARTPGNLERVNERIGILEAELSGPVSGKEALRNGMFLEGTALKHSSPIANYWYWLACEQTNDAAGIASVKAASLGQIGLGQGFTTTGQQLISQGLTAKEVVTYRAGAWYVNSGEDGERGLQRGVALVRSVADKHPSCAAINFGAALNIAGLEGKDTYAGRAYRHGTAAMRKELLALGIFGAHKEAKAMGHRYEHRYFTNAIQREDGTWYETEDP